MVSRKKKREKKPKAGSAYDLGSLSAVGLRRGRDEWLDWEEKKSPYDLSNGCAAGLRR